MAFHQIGELIEHGLALRRRCLRPVTALKYLTRRLNCTVHVRLFAPGHVRQRLLCRGIDDFKRGIIGGVTIGTVNK